MIDSSVSGQQVRALSSAESEFYAMGKAAAGTLGTRELLAEIWQDNPLLRQYLGSIDNPDLIVYRVDPSQVRYMREWALEYHEVQL